jgi:hypothetical protein
MNNIFFSIIIGILIIIIGFYFKNKETRKPSLRLNAFLGYTFFKHFGIILILMGFFLVLISLHSIFYR